MQVRWLKAVDGIGGQPVINAPANARRKMMEMAEELGGTSDLLAVYVTVKCGASAYRSKICAFAKVAPNAASNIQQLQRPDYTWNDDGTGKILWPISVGMTVPWRKIPDDDIKAIHLQIVKQLGVDSWRSLQSALRGRPVRIDSGKYAIVGAILSQYVVANQHKLINLPDVGDDGAIPGSHRR